MASCDLVGHGEPGRVGQPPSRLGQPGQELMGAAAGVGADQHLAPQVRRQLGQRQPRRLDVVGGGVRPGVPGPQHDGQRLAGPAGAVVGERGQRVEPERLLPGRRGLLLLRVRGHDRGVDVHRDQPAVRARARCRRPAPRPAPAPPPARPGSPSAPAARPRPAARPAGRPPGPRPPARTAPAQPAAPPTSARQSPPSATATARSATIFPGIVHRPRRPPPAQPRRQLPAQARHPQRLGQQHAPRPGRRSPFRQQTP